MEAQVDDELAIRNLLAALSWQADRTMMEDLPSYVECFTEDAVWEMFGATVPRSWRAPKSGAATARTDLARTSGTRCR